MVRVCFVCLGNICRSPTAEAVFRHLVEEAGLSASVEIDSAGTGDWHAGEAPDARSTATAALRGILLGGRARQVISGDFERFDYLVAMDLSNHRNLTRLAPSREARARVHLFRDFDPASPRGSEVPDPYYGGSDGFEVVLDVCEAAGRGLLAHLRETHRLR